ncbi:MAG TPA: hypothetical protein V6D05_18840 [Stenomitos sp.]
MRTRSWRTWWVAGAILLLVAQGAIAASSLQEFEARTLQAIARHADREAASGLIEAWQQRTQGAISPASVALNEGLSGHYLTAKQLMARVVAEHPEDASARLGALVLVLLEGNPPTCRQAIEDLAAVYPENPQLQQRYSDVLESMGLAPAALPTPPEPADASASEPTEPSPEPAATPAPTVTESKEIRPVQTESMREQLLRQLAESQARQAKEEAARQQRLKDEQARKRREEAARLAAEKQRREDAAKQATELQHQQEQARLAAVREKAEQARLAEEKRQAEARQAAARKAAAQLAEKRKAEQQKAEQAKLAEQLQAEQARQAAEQRRRLEKAEQDRWLAARRQQPSAPPSPVIPPPPAVEGPSYVLKPVQVANRRVWIGEDRASVHARLGRPKSTEGPGLERYAGLSIWFDARGKVSTFELESAWYSGPGGVRPGLTLREVLRALPNSDGLFHLRPTEPEATSSLYVLSTVDGTIAELQFNDEAWLSTMVRTTTPAEATHLYEELLQKGPVRRLAPDYVFALEARRRPLP